MTSYKIIEGTLVGKKYKPDLVFNFRVAVPEVDVESYAMLVDHDNLSEPIINSMIRLSDEGKAPYCAVIGVAPGYLLFPNGAARDMRMNSYDLFDREYGDFLVYELIPYITETYGIKFSDNPDMHCVMGGSSGGMSAFVVAWFHPDYFHRVYMSTPSFLSMGRGFELPYLIRKYETKPFRVYSEVSEFEPNEYFGWSKAIVEETHEALRFAKYDFNCEYFPGEGHCSRYENEETSYKRSEWIWHDWDTKPITAPANSHRVDVVVPFGTDWEKCDQFPEKEASDAPKALTDEFRTVVSSNDGLAWYAANLNDDVVYLYIKLDDITLERRLLHATLHTIPRHKNGAIDMAVAKTDRLFVLTEIGIQCVRSYGLIDVILNLPDDSKPEKIAITDALYVKTEKGIYKRPLQPDCVIDSDIKRKQVHYYDI
jgi:hypothetical protein